MGFYFQDFTIINTYLELALIIAVPVIVYLILRKFVRQPVFHIILFTIALVNILCWVFELGIVCYILISIYLLTCFTGMFINLGAFRPYLLNSSPDVLKKGGKKRKSKSETLYDRDEMISKVNEAVQICVQINKNKTYDRLTQKNEAGIGLLICFERNDKLDAIIDSGYEILNADVSPRLLTSIFFEGTQLHDGAVIIRDGKIYAASAFLPPTTDPVVGKFGARHRAAKGVTQKSDCVALLVSEETGEIIIFDDGDGVVVEPEDFERRFKDIYDNPARLSSDI